MASEFDFLNELSSDMQAGTVDTARKFKQQTDSLSTILSGVNQQLKTVKSKKRDSDFFFTTQASKLAEASDKVVLDVARAKADPFHGIKVLFSDEKSIHQLAVDHQKIQNEMNIVNRRFSSGSAEYNAELTNIQHELLNATQQRQLTRESLQATTAAASALSTQIGARANIVQQQLSKMTLEDMVRELENPSIPDLPRGTLETAILARQDVMGKLQKTTATGAKNQLEMADKLFSVLSEFPEQIPTDLMQQAVQTNSDTFVPTLGTTVTPQQAQLVLDRQSLAQREQDTLIAEMSMQSAQSEFAFRNATESLIRANPSGYDLITIDPTTGLATGIDTTKLPNDEAELYTKIQDAQGMVNLLESEIRGGTLQGQELLTAARQTSALRSLIIKNNKDLSALAATRAGDRYVDEQAKKAGAEFVEMGLISSPEGAVAVGTELAASLTSTAVSAETFGFGWSVGMKQTMRLFDAKLKEYAALNPQVLGETEELDTEGLILSMLKNERQQEMHTLFRASVKETNARGDNMAGEAVLQDWLEVGSAHAVNHMIDTVHAGDPASQAVLQSVLATQDTLSAAITRSDDGFTTLFTLLRLRERKAIADGALSKESNLVGELQNMLLNDKTYQRPFMKQLTTPAKDGSAMLNKLLFENAAPDVFKQSMKQQIISLPIANIDQAIDSAYQAEDGLLSKAGDLVSGAFRSLVSPGVSEGGTFAGSQLGTAVDELMKEHQPEERSLFNAARGLIEADPTLKINQE